MILIGDVGVVFCYSEGCSGGGVNLLLSRLWGLELD
jgi:hypothetical protein